MRKDIKINNTQEISKDSNKILNKVTSNIFPIFKIFKQNTNHWKSEEG